jgi:hypothetical protein
MKQPKSKTVKSMVVLIAAALLAASMITGGDRVSKITTVAASPPASASPAGHTVAVKRLKQSGKDGNALLILQFNNEEKLGRQLTIQINNRAVVFHDDATGGDEVAGDRRLSALVNLNFAELSASQSRIQALSGQSKTGLSLPIFDGRVLVGEQEMSLPLSGTELQPGQEVTLQAVAAPSTIDPARSLIIRDPRVVEDPRRTFNPCSGIGTPMGKWTFGYLMEQMANQPVTGIDPSTFVRKWLSHWESNLAINGWGVPLRQSVKDTVITPWENASGGPGNPLDLSKAPFKLLAIVNRIDLRGTSGYNTNTGGEARFVFGVIDLRTRGCVASEMTVILEYGIDKRDCDELKDWAKQWVNLSSIPLGSAAYNAALENITEQFAKAGAAPHKVNESALNQVRTNEFLPPVTAPWELREFRLTMGKEDPLPSTGGLLQTTVKQNPDEVLNNTNTLADYINGNCGPILSDSHIVPLSFPRSPLDPPLPNPPAFLGGNAFVPPAFWNAPGLSCDPSPPGNARFKFSLATCSGCHLSETSTSFYHIRPTNFGTPAILSPFLSGPITVNDPVNGFPRNFDELLRRATILDQLANGNCDFGLSAIFNRILIEGEKGTLSSGSGNFVH